MSHENQQIPSKKGKKINLSRLTMLALFTAMVFVSNLLSIPIATPLGGTRLHLGNVLCLLSGFLLGPLGGGAAAGVGSMLYDFTNPLYIAESPITLLNKFVMAFVCGLISRKTKHLKTQILWKILSGASGALAYVTLYILKNYLQARFVQLMDHEAARLAILTTKLPVSLVNAALAVAVSIPLCLALEKVMGSRRFGDG